MTAIQHAPASTDTLPQAIRRLEAAKPGDLALHPDGGEVCAIKMGTSGTPWMFDPSSGVTGPTHVTTATLAQLGYRADTYMPERTLDVAPTQEEAEAHLDSLLADGWVAYRIAEAAGVAASTVKQLRKGRAISTASMARIMLVDTDDPTGPVKLSVTETAEDLTWLLDGGVTPLEAVRRCGLASVESARKMAGRAERPDLLPRLPLAADEPQEVEEHTGGPTAQDFVLQAVEELGEATIADLIIGTGLTRQGVRYHLDILVRQGRVLRMNEGSGRTAVYAVSDSSDG